MPTLRELIESEELVTPARQGRNDETGLVAFLLDWANLMRGHPDESRIRQAATRLSEQDRRIAKMARALRALASLKRVTSLKVVTDTALEALGDEDNPHTD